MGNIIEIKDLSFSYDKKMLYDGFSLTLKIGTFVTIMGKSGSGKSTLAKIMAGVINSKSYIKINNMFVNAKNIKSIRKSVGFISENSNNLFVFDTIEENIYFALKSYGYERSDVESIIKKLSKKLDIEYLLPLQSNSLSGGERQLIALLVALSHHPNLLIIDDGLTMIDINRREKIFKFLKSLNKKGLTIINFTHDSEELLKGNEIIIIQDGKIALQSDLKHAFLNDKVFTDNKLTLPFIVDLSIKLQYYHTIDKIYLNSKQLVNDIWK